MGGLTVMAIMLWGGLYKVGNLCCVLGVVDLLRAVSMWSFAVVVEMTQSTQSTKHDASVLLQKSTKPTKVVDLFD